MMELKEKKEELLLILEYVTSSNRFPHCMPFQALFESGDQLDPEMLAKRYNDYGLSRTGVIAELNIFESNEIN